MTEEKALEVFTLFYERRLLEGKKSNLFSRSLLAEEIDCLGKMYEDKIKEITQKIRDL